MERQTAADHPIPEWRPGVVYWKPTSDGREIGVYPLLFGAGLLYRGPLAEYHGYDQSWRFPRVVDAIETARSWDGEGDMPHPETVTEVRISRRAGG